MFLKETVPLFCVCCLWFIPNGMNTIDGMAFSTELYCLRQILTPRIIADILPGEKMYGCAIIQCRDAIYRV
jgi:hypothetical protein